MRNVAIPIMLFKKKNKEINERLFVFSMLFHSDLVTVLK